MITNTYDTLGISKTPELIFGLVGPIGIDMEMVQKKLENALISVGYKPTSFRVTDLMKQIETDIIIKDDKNPLTHYENRIDYANAVRKKCQNDAALAALSMLAIKTFRANHYDKNESQDNSDDSKRKIDRPIDKQAYIIRQFKRKEEVSLFRAVYGKKFIQISVHMNPKDREENLVYRISQRNHNLKTEELEDVARKLIKRDYDESAAVHGQRVAEAFHLGDVFVSAKSEKESEETIQRFIKAFFGKNSLSPSRDEYGAYIAASASYRSIDTSRQIGAAIFTTEGEIIAMGSNEVPAYGGGTYWSDHPEPHRDFDDQRDANNVRKKRITYDFLNRLNEAGFLNMGLDKGAKFDSVQYEKITSNRNVKKALLNDITEYGRMAHAEMNAITDAARLGRSTKNSTLFGTTFPCHNCAKHIVAAGIKRVVFIEPYPKSQAIKLSGDSISFEEQAIDKVVFQHFVGISPRRYRDIFEKGKRRDSDGSFREWYEGTPVPRVIDRGAGYVNSESSAIYSVLEKVKDELSPK